MVAMKAKTNMINITENIMKVPLLPTKPLLEIMNNLFLIFKKLIKNFVFKLLTVNLYVGGIKIMRFRTMS